jgi:hypothetical protein
MGVRKISASAVVYLRKRGATIVIYGIALNGRPAVVRVTKRVAERLIEMSRVRRRFASGVSLRLNSAALAYVILASGVDARGFDIFTIDKAVKRAYRTNKEVREMVNSRAATLGREYVRVWLSAGHDGVVPEEMRDVAEAVSMKAPTRVVWAYGRYIVQIPPWL